MTQFDASLLARFRDDLCTVGVFLWLLTVR